MRLNLDRNVNISFSRVTERKDLSTPCFLFPSVVGLIRSSKISHNFAPIRHNEIVKRNQRSSVEEFWFGASPNQIRSETSISSGLRFSLCLTNHILSMSFLRNNILNKKKKCLNFLRVNWGPRFESRLRHIFFSQKNSKLIFHKELPPPLF